MLFTFRLLSTIWRRYSSFVKTFYAIFERYSVLAVWTLHQLLPKLGYEFPELDNKLANIFYVST